MQPMILERAEETTVQKQADLAYILQKIISHSYCKKKQNSKG